MRGVHWHKLHCTQEEMEEVIDLASLYHNRSAIKGGQDGEMEGCAAMAWLVIRKQLMCVVTVYGPHTGRMDTGRMDTGRMDTGRMDTGSKSSGALSGG